MVSGRSGGVLLTFRGGGVGVIAGGRRQSGRRGRRGGDAVIWLGKGDHAGVQQGGATPLLSPRCLEEAFGGFTARYFVNILGCELDSIGDLSEVCVRVVRVSARDFLLWKLSSIIW